MVKTTIERYMLNRDLDMKDKIYLVNPNYLQTKINALMGIPGEIGFTVRMGLFTGLREEELYYIHDRETCYNELGCKCNNLHPININCGVTIIGINWIRGNKKAFVTILPTKMWEQFRRITKFDRHDIVAAHSITKRDAGCWYIIIMSSSYDQSSTGYFCKLNVVKLVASQRCEISFCCFMVLGGIPANKSLAAGADSRKLG